MRPLSEKYALSLTEAAEYFGIGKNKLSSIVKKNIDEGFAVINGNRYLIIRKEFEEFLKSNPKL